LSVAGDARFIPSPAHLERVLHLLQQYYPRQETSVCRLALARMFGHEGWGELQSAMREGGTSPCDEDLPREAVAARYQQQLDSVLALLAGITDESMLAAQALDQEIFAVDRDAIGKRYHPAFNEKRLERARLARRLAYARQAILDIRPTARDSATIAPDRDDIDLSYRVDLLPRALESWLAHHRPLLRAWGERIGEMKVRQHAGIDLLDFSYCWGEACLDGPAEIPKPLQLYPIALSAKWFAWITCARIPRLEGAFAVLRSGRSREEERRRADRLITDALQEEEARFILAQPREDFRTHSASAREQHIHAGFALVRRWMSEAASRSTVREIMSRGIAPSLSPAIPGG
jgi:hypothetical protein